MIKAYLSKFVFIAAVAGLFGLACGTDQMKEGTRAFLEKRKPEFK